MSNSIKYKYTPLKELRANAKERLLGSMGACVLVTFLFAVAKFTLMMCSSTTMLANGILGVVINQIADFITSGFLGIFQVIVCSFFLRLYSSKGFSGPNPEQIRMSTPDKIIIITLLISAIQLIVSLPYLIYGYFIMEDTLEGYVILFGLFFAVNLISYLATLPFAFVYLVLSDMPYLNIKQTIKMSAFLMKGNYLRYIGMQLSLLPVTILSFISFGIGFLWASPYINLSNIALYSDISNKKAGN